MRDVERRLISELVRDSRRSDRELARIIGTSQPTVSRLIRKLEKEGIIQEYTVIPDFRKLGYELLGLTFVKLKKNLGEEETEKAREMARDGLTEDNLEIVMLERGLGLGYDGVIIAFYEDYATYMEHKNKIRQYPFLELSEVESFLISLKDNVRYRPLTFKTLAKHLLTLKVAEAKSAKKKRKQEDKP